MKVRESLSQVIFRSFPLSEFPGGPRNSKSCDADFAFMDSGFTVFPSENILNIHAKREVTLSAEELDIVSKNNLSKIS